MARRKREDEPGSILHVFNRGVGKRTVFENRSDVRIRGGAGQAMPGPIRQGAKKGKAKW